MERHFGVPCKELMAVHQLPTASKHGRADEKEVKRLVV